MIKVQLENTHPTVHVYHVSTSARLRHRVAQIEGVRNVSPPHSLEDYSMWVSADVGGDWDELERKIHPLIVTHVNDEVEFERVPFRGFSE